MNNAFFKWPEILTIPYTDTSSRNKTRAPSAVCSETVDLSEYLIPAITAKDTPLITHYTGYKQARSPDVTWGADPDLYEKHIWVEKRLFNAPNAEKLYLYSVRDQRNQLKQINNFYTLYPKLLKSEPFLLIEDEVSVSWEYERLVNIGKIYPFVNNPPNAETFEVARRMDTFTSKVSNRIQRTDEDVIELLYRFEGNLIYTEYFSKGRGLVSTVTPDYILIQQDL